MKILYHHRTQGHGAEGVHITGIVTALRRSGHEVTLLNPPGVDPESTAGSYLYGQRAGLVSRLWRWISKWLPQILFELLELSYNVSHASRLRAALRAERYDLIFERYAFFLSTTARMAARRGIALMLEVNEVAGIPRARPLVLRRLAQRMEARTLQRASGVVVVSGFLRDWLHARGVARHKILVLPNAVDQTLFGQSHDSNSVREELSLGPSLVLGFIGWIDPWDNLERLLAVFGDLCQHHRHLKLLLIGDVVGKGVGRDVVPKLIAKLGLEGQVVSLPRVPRAEIPRHIAAMDICVIPDSNDFGSPVVLFEYMAMGRTVVAVDVEPVTDVLVDGENGLLFSKDDPASLTKVLRKAIEDEALRRRLGENARHQVESRHTWDANVEQILTAVGDIGDRGLR